MTKLPADLSGKTSSSSDNVVRRQRGSHIILRRDSPPARVVVPNHKAIRIGTLRSILHAANVTVDELIDPL